MLLLPVLGQLLGNIFILLNIIFFDEMNADWLIINGLRGLTGDMLSFFAFVYVFITDKSSGD